MGRLADQFRDKAERLRQRAEQEAEQHRAREKGGGTYEGGTTDKGSASADDYGRNPGGEGRV